MKNILFLCTGNSARSIMAEGYMNNIAYHWRAYSAGSQPTRTPNPLAIQTLISHGIEMEAPRSKNWDEFAADDAPIMHTIITVCDNAAGETCPIWPEKNGRAPKRLHWSLPDPAAATGSIAMKREAFEKVFADIRMRIDKFLAEQK